MAAPMVTGSGTEFNFISRRSPVVSLHGSVASSQPLASQIGLDILKRGGNAADAAVAMAAALNVTEPCSTGPGGDCFCLFYEAATKTVKGLNGSGRAPAKLTLDLLCSQGFSADCPPPPFHAHNVTVPGAAAGWVDTIEHFGSKKLSLLEILQPAIQLAEEGFPVTHVTAYHWAKGAALLQYQANTHGGDLLIQGKAPREGEIMKNPHLAQTFRELASKGKSGFYQGRIAQAIADAVLEHGGVLSLDDLSSHTSTLVDPISVDYRGVRVWEIPPNGQGITALMALNILEGFDMKEFGHNTADYLHVLIEAIRLSFADSLWHCADMSKVKVPVDQLLSKDYAAQRRQLINMDSAMEEPRRGDMASGNDTVYFSVVDGEGNACSFINSNYMGFGTGLVPKACGFTLQNRGANFSLQPDHPNVVSPGKRPYHTIIPAMVTDSRTDDLLMCYGIMGGFMQPQAHVQVLLNMLEFGMDPQQALDQPRLCVGPGHEGAVGSVALEQGIHPTVMEKLKAKGHEVVGPITGHGRSLFGRGQIITKGAFWLAEGDVRVANDKRVLWSGSDPRADGLAIGF
ncbi:glutathione hydrolase-like YwrD proenzyme isoform X1 [Branchiostoma floridae x Branchiostoma japonicum]